MKPFKTALIVGAFALLGQGNAQAISKHPLAVNVKQLHPDAALFAAREAMEACRAVGLHTVTVSVVDRRSVELVTLRDVAAPRITLEVARAKAYTANEFSAPTSALKRLQGSPLAHRENVFLDGGGVPIESAGIYYGAIGVAGSPTQEQDEACAQVGAKKLQFELDMM